MAGAVFRLADVPMASVLFLFVFVVPAYAYADPGTGSLIWQMVAATFVGTLFYFRKFLLRFRPRKRKGKQR